MFTESSINIRLLGNNILVADCRTISGVYRFSSLDLDTLLGNINGEFVWGKQEFSQSARRVTLAGSVLAADLRNTAGAWVYATVELSHFIQNNDGVLEGDTIPEIMDGSSLGLELHKSEEATDDTTVKTTSWTTGGTTVIITGAYTADTTDGVIDITSSPIDITGKTTVDITGAYTVDTTDKVIDITSSAIDSTGKTTVDITGAYTVDTTDKVIDITSSAIDSTGKTTVDITGAYTVDTIDKIIDITSSAIDSTGKTTVDITSTYTVDTTDKVIDTTGRTIVETYTSHTKKMTVDTISTSHQTEIIIQTSEQGKGLHITPPRFTNFRLENTILRVDCLLHTDKLVSQWHKPTYAPCFINLDSYLGNIDGLLTPGFAAFSKTSRNVEVKDTYLVAECQTESGKWLASRLDLCEVLNPHYETLAEAARTGEVTVIGHRLSESTRNPSCFASLYATLLRVLKRLVGLIW